MSELDKLRKSAATIMAHLEDANGAALKIQSHDISLTDIAHGFKAIRIELRHVDNILSKVDSLIVIINPQ